MCIRDRYKLSKQGIASYRNLIAHETVLRRLLPMKKHIDELKSQDLEKFKRDRIAEGVGAESIKYGLLLIRGTLKFAHQLGYQVSDIAFPQIKLPKNSLRYLSDDEERRLLVALDPMRHGAGLPPVAERSAEMQRFLQDAYDLVILLLLSLIHISTLSVDDASTIIAALKTRFPFITGPKKDDICYATQNRQDAMKMLVKQCDVVVVVGSPNSSNSNRLREVAANVGVPAYLVNDAEELLPEWFAGKARVGISAGASAPEVLVQGVIARMEKMGGEKVIELQGIVENVVFPLPRTLIPIVAKS